MPEVNWLLFIVASLDGAFSNVSNLGLGIKLACERRP